MWASVILLEKHRSNQRNQLWSQNPIDITPNCQFAVYYQQTRSKVVVYGAPDHDATSAKPVTFHNAVVGAFLSVASVHVYSSIILVQIEMRLIAKDDIMPADTSLVVLTKVIAKLLMTFSLYGSIIWSTAANTEVLKRRDTVLR